MGDRVWLRSDPGVNGTIVGVTWNSVADLRAGYLYATSWGATYPAHELTFRSMGDTSRSERTRAAFERVLERDADALASLADS